jgi:hypothetical protein
MPHSSHKVHIVGDVSVTGSIYADNYIIKSVSTIESDGDSKFGDSSGDTHQFYGKVAAGPVAVFTPSATVHVRTAASSISSIDAIGDDLVVENSTNTGISLLAGSIHAAGLYFPNASDTDHAYVKYDHGTDAMAIRTNGHDAIHIKSDSKVGIGSNSGGLSDPDAQLEILDTGTQLKLSYDSNSYATLAVASDSGLTIASAESGDITLDPGGSDVIADGNFLPNADSTRSLGSASKRWANIYTGDLHLKNDRGDWTVVEEADYLSVINNATGKRYRLMMEEIED